MKMEIRFVDNIERLHDVYSKLKDQKSVTCGPYSLLKIARSVGNVSGNELNENNLARLCGTVISPEEYELSRRLHGANEDELDEQTRERYYPIELQVSDNEDLQGTSALGVIEASRKILGDTHHVHPIPSRKGDKVLLDKAKFRTLGEVMWKGLGTGGLNAIFNVQVDRFCSNESLSTPVDVFRLLGSGECAKLDEWSVGHFIVLAGIIRTSGKGGEQYYYILQDSYKKRGMSGYLIQPESNLRDALVRDDGSEGGVILLVPGSDWKSYGTEIEEEFRASGWDNGTPYMEEKKH